MSKLSVALIGPAGLPDSTGEGLWCPRALRERAWAAWRAKGLPSKGVEDYLYMDWKRLESVTVVPNQPNAITQDNAEYAHINFRTSSPSEFGSADGCKVSLLDSAPADIQNEVAAHQR